MIELVKSGWNAILSSEAQQGLKLVRHAYHVRIFSTVRDGLKGVLIEPIENTKLKKVVHMTGGLEFYTENNGSTDRYVLVFRNQFSTEYEALLKHLLDESHYMGLGPKQTPTRFLQIFERWLAFLRGIAEKGRRDIQGIFGELLFLRNALRSGVPTFKLLNAWKITHKSAKDFHFVENDVSIEVKTKGQSDPGLISISSLEQLETSHGNVLVIYFINLLINNRHGISIADIYTDIRESMSDVEANRFDHILFQFSLPPPIAREIKMPEYEVTDVRCFSVADGFPRMTRETCPSQIAKASYDIDSNLIPSEFHLPEKQVYGIIHNAAGRD